MATFYNRNRFGGRDWGKTSVPEQQIFNILKNQEKILEQQEKIMEQQKKIIKRFPPPFIPPDCEYL